MVTIFTKKTVESIDGFYEGLMKDKLKYLRNIFIFLENHLDIFSLTRENSKS